MGLAGGGRGTRRSTEISTPRFVGRQKHWRDLRNNSLRGREITGEEPAIVADSDSAVVEILIGAVTTSKALRI